MNSLLTFGKQLIGGAFVIALFSANAVYAGDEVFMTLTNASEGKVIELTEDDLLAMEQFTVLTANEFIDGLAEFTGPLARDVVALLNDAEIETVKLTAINDYAVDIPVTDILDYDVIFALAQDGVTFSARDKGPIWVIYPMSDNTELQDRVYNDRLIWQLVRVDAL